MRRSPVENFGTLITGSQYYRFIANRDSGGTGGWHIGWAPKSGAPVLYTDIAGNEATWSFSPSANTWYFIVWSQTGTTPTLYVNNSLVTVSGSVGAITDAGVAMTIGYGYGGGGNQNFNGDLDEVLLYSKVLSANERTDLYNGSAGQTMCNGTGGPVCGGGNPRRREVILSFKPENSITIKTA